MPSAGRQNSITPIEPLKWPPIKCTYVSFWERHRQPVWRRPVRKLAPSGWHDRRPRRRHTVRCRSGRGGRVGAGESIQGPCVLGTVPFRIQREGRPAQWPPVSLTMDRPPDTVLRRSTLFVCAVAVRILNDERLKRPDHVQDVKYWITPQCMRRKARRARAQRRISRR